MFAVLMSALLMAAAEPPPAAAGPSTPDAAAQPAKKANGSERVCWEERPTASHIPKTICATRDELARAQQEAKDALSRRVAPPKKGFGPS